MPVRGRSWARYRSLRRRAARTPRSPLTPPATPNSAGNASSSRTVAGAPSSASSSASVAARVICSNRTSSAGCSGSEPPGNSWASSGRCSPRNQCSLRHRPTPVAPSRIATATSAGDSALANTATRPAMISSAHVSSSVISPGSWGVVGAGVRAGVWTAPPTISPAATRPTATSPSGARRMTPVDPSTTSASPDLTVAAPKRADPASKLSRSTPHTAGTPQPRATMAAWLAVPPPAVTTAAA